MKRILLFLTATLTLFSGAAEDLLKNAPWRFLAVSGGSGNVEKLSGDGRKITSSSDKGYVSYANARDLPITPGQKYTIRMTLVKENAEANASMLVSIGKRRPWPSVKSNEVAGTPETLVYRFTAGPEERTMRVHAIVSGHGSVTVSAITRDEGVSETAEAPVTPAASPATGPAKPLDLLRSVAWRLAKDGGDGTAEKLADGTCRVTSTAAKGVVSYANARNLPIQPGKNYQVEMLVVRDPGSTLTMLVSIGKRRPWPAIKADELPGKPEKLVYRFTAGPEETTMRVHAIVGGTGTVTLQSVTRQELSDAELCTRMSDRDMLHEMPWRFLGVGGGAGKLEKLPDGGRRIVSTESRGYVSYANSASQPIEPGKNYLVTATVIREKGTNFSMLVSIGKRRPWPSVRASGKPGVPETLTYMFTAQPGETAMRVHAVITGMGKVELRSIRRQEISEAESQRMKKQAKVRLTDFDAAGLTKYWKPVNLRDYREGGALAFESYPFGGLECATLDWEADKIKSVDLRMSSSEPGYLYFEFTTSAGQKSFLSQAAYPGTMRDYVFPVAENPAWKGRITSVRFIWRAYERICQLSFERVTANAKPNLIPFAGLNQKAETPIKTLRPRAKCELAYENGVNPGMTLRCFDWHGKTLLEHVLAPGKAKGEFVVPVMCAKATLTVNSPAPAGGFPRIAELEWPKPDKKPVDWHGKWIWSGTEFGPFNENVWFGRKFTLDGEVREGAVIFTADDAFTAYVNGREVCSGSSWRTPVRADITRFLRPGENVVTVRTWNEAANGGLIGELYAKTDRQTLLLPTDAAWQCRIGGKTPPEQYTGNALEIGAPPTSPWGDLTYAYVGPKGQVTVNKAGNARAEITVNETVPVHTDKITLLLKYPDGRSRKVTAGVTPDTSKWQTGKTLEVKLDLPPVAGSGVTAEMATDFIISQGTFCSVPGTDGKPPQLPEAKIVGAGTRPYFVIDGRKYPPIYYDGYNKVANDWMLGKARLGGCKVVRTSCNMHLMWKSENEFDFSIVDQFMDKYAVNAPEMKVILQVKVTMPDWWLAKYPDDVVAYHSGIPYSKAHDRQALASERWLKDGSYALRQLLRHIKNSPYADRIFAIGISEGWNSEWFWSMLKGATSGYSKSDLATFRKYLREAYATDEALAKAWGQPGLTFDTIKMPMPAEIDKASCQELLDPVKDRRTIDYFRFRNRALGDAIETFGKVVKEETDNRCLVGVYYGYYVMFSHVNRKLQTVGHLDVERLARSPYVDMFWAPSLYHWRQIGMPDGIMQAADALSLHGKLVIVEQDMRTFSEPAHMQAGNGRTNTVEQTHSAMIRALGLLLARGVGTHWYDMHEIWFREPVLLEMMKSINETYMTLPPVKGTTPAEICLVSDPESALYTRHNFAANLHKSTVYELCRTFNQVGAPFRHVFLSDLLEADRVPAHKFYILTDLVMLTPEKYRKLEARFAREKATVLHLYATGVTRPGSGPSAENMAELLGLKFRMTSERAAPVLPPVPGFGAAASVNPVASAPWFLPVSGFAEAVGRGADGTPLLVRWERGGANHYFSVVMKPHVELLRELARRAGVHLYSATAEHPLHVGNDCLFVVPRGDDGFVPVLRPGQQLRGIIGESAGKVFRSGERIPTRNGVCIGFIVE